MKLMDVLGPLWKTAKGVIPLTAALVIIQTVILKKPIEEVKNFTTGILITLLGLHLFLYGTSVSLIPLGDSVGRHLYVLDNKWIIILIGFVIGYSGTLVEPALRALALQVEELSQGAIPQTVLLHSVAAGFGLGLSVGLYRIMSNVSYVRVIIPLLIIIILLSIVTPDPYTSIAMDSASATTGPVNIPINMAIAIGLASIIEGVDPLLSGLGIVGLTSIGSMVSVMILGVLTKF